MPQKWQRLDDNMSRHQYFIAILFILGCNASLATESSAPRIEFRHFSFSTPNTDTWKLIEKTDRQSVFTTRHGRAIYRITIIENYIYDETIKTLPAKEAADDYRNHERFRLMEFCEKREIYELRDLTMGDEQIDNKVFYTMKYLTINPQIFQSARLYLYYPLKKANNYFLMAHYCEAAPNQGSLIFSFESDFLQLLKSVSHVAER
jgi:hypothetical protein